MIDFIKIPEGVIWSVIGGLFMIINTLLWQKINQLDKNGKEIEQKLFELEKSGLQKLEETEVSIQRSIRGISEAIYALEIKILKDFVTKNECERKEIKRRIRK